jgi:hypothetical protein
MTSIDHTFESQKKIVFQEHPKLKIVSACNINSGIIAHNPIQKEEFQKIFQGDDEYSKCFFIPASGAGSRMFQFLFDFLNNADVKDNYLIEHFVQNLHQYAFYHWVRKDLKDNWHSGDVNLEDLFKHLLFDDGGLNLSNLPKGMIPFHRFSGFILNAFQEHYMQGLKVANHNLNFHFTIDKKFEKEINGALKTVQKLSGTKCPISFSEQDPTTHSFAFDYEGNVVLGENDEPLRRPAGHGALLPNLNALTNDIVFIKNIDNVQHLNKSSDSIDAFQYLGGLLIHVQNEFRKAYNHPDPIAAFKKLNEQYQLIYQSSIELELSEDDVRAFLNRPLRVCGMVKNEGQSGGGPFWVDINGQITKQIVEKSQIDMRGGQSKLMVQSRYFNPVMIAASKKDLFGKDCDLNEYADKTQYFIVEKQFKGNPIRFIEKPGLWNGSMAHWNSIFVELSGNIFTPVKMISDLLRKEHLES